MYRIRFYNLKYRLFANRGQCKHIFLPMFKPRFDFGAVKLLWQLEGGHPLCSLVVICMLALSASVSYVCPYSTVSMFNNAVETERRASPTSWQGL